MGKPKLTLEEQKLLDSVESGAFESALTESRTKELEAVFGVEQIRKKLIQAEQSGFADQTPEEILSDIKNGFGSAGNLGSE